LSPTKHDIEHAVATIQGILVAIFFFTVGFEIDVHLIFSQPLTVLSVVAAILLVKTILATAACRAFALPLSVAQRIGLVLSQGGEFAFVALRTARAAGILGPDTTRLVSTAVALTMATTPALESLGAHLQPRLEQREKEQRAQASTKVVVATPSSSSRRPKTA
jgi:monovalent cation:H+ antiporter-2, CPA2 family